MERTYPSRYLIVAMRGVAASLVIALCTAASSSSTYTLIVNSRVSLGAISGVPADIDYTPVSGTIVDLNGDGLPDVLVGMNGSPPVIYFNNGTPAPFASVEGIFVSPPPGYDSPGISWGAAVVADVNNDGHPDIAIAGFNASNMIYLNDGSATPFNGIGGIAIGTGDTAGFELALGDVNGDGFVDMAVANTNHLPSRIYLTHGAPLTAGTYTTEQIGTDLGYGQDAKIADVNGDGKPDLILTYEMVETTGTDPSGIAIYLNNGTADPFADVTPLRLAVGQSVNAIAVADLNGDRKPDLVAVASNGSLTQNGLYVYLNTGSSSQPFSAFETLQSDNDLGGGCLSVSIGDVNGDGLPDLAFSCVAGTASAALPNPAEGALYLNNGTSAPFADVVPFDIPAAAGAGYARSVSLGALVKNGTPNVLVVDGFAASYYSTLMDQNPAAQNDSATVAVNGGIAIDILANDTASTGQSLNSDSVAITTAPQHGAASAGSNGLVTYQPTTGYFGSDSFQYTVQDGLGALSNTATVSVNVQPAPVAINDTASVVENKSVPISVLANDTSSGGTISTASITIVVAPTHGNAVISSGTVVYTPSQGYLGLDTFQYTVRDNLGTPSNTATVSINVTAPPSGGGGGGAFSVWEIGALASFLLSQMVLRRARLAS